MRLPQQAVDVRGARTAWIFLISMALQQGALHLGAVCEDVRATLDSMEARCGDLRRLATTWMALRADDRPASTDPAFVAHPFLTAP